jgi:L,D-peptidoglycan transpeptidase YkuD (ErfK/YbiS/YcfS/YnhG family)
MDLFVNGDGTARFGSRLIRCAVGRSGLSAVKREGDGATPIGAFPCRLLYWRPDRQARPPTLLPSQALSPADGWCDDPADPAYNHPVRLPYPRSAEALWRADGLYDLIVPLGYNDSPVIPGRGSAIFLHVARPDYAGTEGCVALALADLRDFVATASRTSRVVITP